jgi:hypothetical protein
MTLEVFGTVLLFSLAVLIQDIVAQDLAGSTEVNGEAAPVFETMLLVTDTE